ncbi:MAG TPA: glycosyltransferase [Bryobacteraceae bacterium]|jgi:UDP-galactopyranose mutase|nr:glycosyltransferase [Bryobacteraceae bacterium]
MRECLKDLFRQERIQDFVAWYYTPMAIEFTDELTPALTVYDCMDELSAFAHAPTGMLANENKLFQQANLVFTGGLSLYEAKCSQHPDVHLFPSSVDRAHFARAMESIDEPPDQSSVPHPRIGYAGVIDERMDLDLLAFLADSRPEWHIVLLGPVVKINVDDIPSRPNIHLLGKKPYEELPAYLSGWDVALLPFAQNDATRFISPTKTPEYLAADLPVVSTPIRDVERPYGKLGLVSIGRTHREFLEAVEQQLLDGRPAEWRTEVDSFLRALSWDKTWAEMERLICRDLDRSQRESVQEQTAPLPIAKRRVSVAHV